MSKEKLDPRRHAYRDDLADVSLRNRVAARRYVDGQTAQIASMAPVRQTPSDTAMLMTEALPGETAAVFETGGDWSWVKLLRDGYVGYIPSRNLASGISFASHTVVAPKALMFPEPDLKTPPVGACFMGAELTLSGPHGAYMALPQGGYVHERTVAPVGTTTVDFVATAERFVGTTYLWGGKTVNGIDCSGLVQVAMHAAGMTCPRDSDMQMNEVGSSLGDDPKAAGLRRGDLIFWDGHVGVMSDPTTLLHANAWHMETAHEPLSEAVHRIASDGKPVLDIRRP